MIYRVYVFHNRYVLNCDDDDLWTLIWICGWNCCSKEIASILRINRFCLISFWISVLIMGVLNNSLTFNLFFWPVLLTGGMAPIVNSNTAFMGVMVSNFFVWQTSKVEQGDWRDDWGHRSCYSNWDYPYVPCGRCQRPITREPGNYRSYKSLCV